MPQPELRIRSLEAGATLDKFLSLSYVLNDEVEDDLIMRRRRQAWTWVAESEGVVVARLSWWSKAGNEVPAVLDILDVRNAGDPRHVDAAHQMLVEATVQVIGADARRPSYNRRVRPDWRDDDLARTEADALMSIATSTGARLVAERRRLEWQAGTPIPLRSARLRFRPPIDDDEVLALMTEVTAGSLDAYTQEKLETMTAAEAAQNHFEGEVGAQISPRSNWRVAIDGNNRAVGFVTPGHNPYNPVIGYLAVLPAHRGRGYINDILNEGVSVLAATGVDRIRAATDMTNNPMGNAFLRSGWSEYERSIDMAWPAVTSRNAAGSLPSPLYS